MRLHRFFIEQKIAPNARVVVRDERLLHQWRDVLRLKAGNEVVLFDGFGDDHRCELATLLRNEAVCVVRDSSPASAPPSLELCLFASLIKKDRFEWLLEKATELSVAFIRPVIADRCEVRQFSLERAKSIVREAAEQSGRGNLPALYEPMELANVFSEYKFFTSIALDPKGTLFKKDEWMKEKRFGAFVGPEGGWSARELELFHQKKIQVCSLGSATLRAETAAAAVSALLLLSS